MHLVENLEEVAAKIFDELPNDFKRKDKNEGKYYNDQRLIGTNDREFYIEWAK
jgi:hypothetical protein